MTDGPNPAPAYRSDIDGLRGIAVLAVIAFHAFPRILPGGFAGVDVFFVISGFLISSIILKGLERGTFSFRDFYVRRVARIFPALILVLAATLTIGWIVMLATEYRRLGLHAGASGAFVANVVFWRDTGYFDAAADLKPLLHLWSLGVEEQFYLAWPLLLVVAARRKLAPAASIVAIGAASFAMSVITTATSPQFAFFLAPARLWELLLGAWLAHESLGQGGRPARAELKSVLGLALVVVGFALVRAEHFPGWWALLPTAGTGLLISAGPDAPINRRLLAQPFLVFVGLISYPLYLWHWPVLSFARLTQLGEPPVGLRVALIGLSFVLAWATYRLVEQPIRFGRFSRAKWRTPALASAMVLVTTGAFVAASGRVPSRLDARYPVLSRFTYDYRAAYRGGECQLNNSQSDADFRRECVDSDFGAPERTSVLLWGDSHAAHLYPGLRSLAAANNLSLAQLTVDACPPVLDHPATYCQKFSRAILDRIPKLDPDVVVLAAKWTAQSSAQVARTVTALQARGISRVVVVGPAPRWTRPVPNVLIRYLQRHPLADPPSRLSDGLEADRFVLDSAMRAAFAGSVMRYVSVISTLCNAEGCLALVNRQPTTWDAEHFTDAGSLLIATVVLRAR